MTILEQIKEEGKNIIMTYDELKAYGDELCEFMKPTDILVVNESIAGRCIFSSECALEACVEKLGYIPYSGIDMLLTGKDKEKALAFINTEMAIINAQNDAVKNFRALPYEICRTLVCQVHIFKGLLQLSYLVDKPWEANEKEVFFMWNGIKFFELRENHER